MRTTILSEDFLSSFGISRVIEEKPKSGQKMVYIVEIEDTIYALKIMSVADERIKRELGIYERFKDNNGIPNVIKTEQYGEDLVVLEEYIEGDDLSKITDRYLGNSLKVRTLIANIAHILAPVWENKCVHRDLKPKNIIIKPDCSPIVLDFGIARDLEDETITPTGFQPFTWAYASPEQVAFKRDLISYRTDFFCLGIIAYHLYTGNYPFGKTQAEIVRTFTGPQISFDVSDELMNNFLNASLKFNVAERPRTIEQFLNILSL